MIRGREEWQRVAKATRTDTPRQSLSSEIQSCVSLFVLPRILKDSLCAEVIRL